MRLLGGFLCQASLVILFSEKASAHLIDLEPSFRPDSSPLAEGSWLESGAREPSILIQTGYGPFGRSAQTAKQRGYLNFSLYDVPRLMPSGWAIVEADVRFKFVVYDSPDEFETMGVFDVSTTPLLLGQIGIQDPSIYEDLGTGALYGSVDVTAADASFSVKLNPTGVAAINRHLGGSFAVGLSLLTLRSEPTVEMLFKGRAVSSILHMRYARVPEPRTAALAISIIATVGTGRRLRLPKSRTRRGLIAIGALRRAP